MTGIPIEEKVRERREREREREREGLREEIRLIEIVIECNI